MTSALDDGWQPDGSGVLAMPAGETGYDGACGEFAYGARFTWTALAPDATLTAWAFATASTRPDVFEVAWMIEYAVSACVKCHRRIKWSPRVEHWLVAEDDPELVPDGACWPHVPWRYRAYSADEGEWHGTAARAQKMAYEAAEIFATTRRDGLSVEDFGFFDWDGVPV